MAIPRLLHALPLLALLGLGGCDPLVLGAVTVGSVATIGRTPVDAVASGVTGRDCSIVRLDRGQTYCREPEPPVQPQVVCTRSRGSVDCWRELPPYATPAHRGVADGPATLTAEQEAHRTRRWPQSLNLF